jgi:endonuclease G
LKDADSTWELWYSTDGGGSWTKTGSSVVTSSTTLTPAISNVNLAVPIRFEIRNVTVSTTARVNFYDFQISGF